MGSAFKTLARGPGGMKRYELAPGEVAQLPPLWITRAFDFTSVGKYQLTLRFGRPENRLEIANIEIEIREPDGSFVQKLRDLRPEE